MRMKAAILFEQGLPRPYAKTRPLVVEEVELDPPGPGEILIEIAAAVRDATDGGVDTVIETAGTIPAMQLAIAITARGGSTISAGLPNVNASVSYLHANLVSEEKSIRGSYMGSCVAERDIPRLLSLYRRGKMPVNKLKSGVVKLEEINEGFDRLSDGTVLRQMLKPNS